MLARFMSAIGDVEPAATEELILFGVFAVIFCVVVYIIDQMKKFPLCLSSGLLPNRSLKAGFLQKSMA